MWFTYIFPLSRLEDFFIGCNLGYIYAAADKKVKNASVLYTVGEILVVISIVFKWVVYVLIISLPAENNIKVISQNWWGNSVYWTITSCVLIYLFAQNRGKVSVLLTNKVFVYIGNMSPYLFLIHQMVYRYLESIERKLFGNRFKIANVFLCFIISILCAHLWQFATDLSKRKYIFK